MSEANRKKVYDKLVENDKLGKTPGLAQDDGALKEEFGEMLTDKGIADTSTNKKTKVKK